MGELGHRAVRVHGGFPKVRVRSRRTSPDTLLFCLINTPTGYPTPDLGFFGIVGRSSRTPERRFRRIYTSIKDTDLEGKRILSALAHPR